MFSRAIGVNLRRGARLKLADILREECILAGAEVSDKAEALRVVTDLAKRSPALADVSAEELRRGFDEREALGSTGFGNGIAIPHCRLASATDFVVGLITLSTAVEFDTADGLDVSVIVFIVGPRGVPNRHLRVLRAISQALLTPADVERLVDRRTPPALREAFLEAVHLDIDAFPTTKKSGIFVIVQDESVLEDVVRVMVPVALGSILLLDASPAAVHLSGIPLFASFLSEPARDFGKILFAVTDRGLGYEAVRAIESVVGSLSDRTGVMVAVQDYAFVAGSLEPLD